MNIDEQLNSILDLMGEEYVGYGMGAENIDMPKAYKEAKSALKKLINEARIEENQRYLDNIKKFREHKIKPGELTAASFGSAGASIVESGYEHAFEDRIEALKEGRDI